MFVDSDKRTCHIDGADVAINILLKVNYKILNKLHACAGNPWCGAVCTNCYEQCTCFVMLKMMQECTNVALNIETYIKHQTTVCHYVTDKCDVYI